jgi:hypothetical protein
MSHNHFSFLGAVLCLGGLLALATPILAKDKAGAGLENAVVLIIRHAEKPDKGVELSEAGQQRAAAYVRYFENFTVGSAPLQVAYLFAAADSKASHRARLTLEPFSQAVGLPIDAQIPETKSKDLVAAIQKKPPGKQILICWHHSEIPNLLAALRADSKSLLGGKNWPDNVFDWVIQLRYDSKGHLLDAKRISEQLMPGDSKQ